MPSRSASAITSGPSTEHGHPWWGYFFIAAASLCWGAAAIFGKAIFNGSLFAGRPAISPMVLTQMRTTFAVMVLSLILLLRFGKEIFRISRDDLGLCFLVGTLGVACSNYFYYLAVQKAAVSLAITVQYTAPVWVLLYMVLVGREKPTWHKTVAALVAMAGTALAIGVFHSNTKISAVAVGAALLASFGYAFYNIGG
ncbi:MAG TPA: DMT family transporter, partial [Candidatus Angelobacter sp.]|nr:DMT family transporter [Candidatus Angelobacter sp.]